MNNVQLIGRLGQDPELKTLTSGTHLANLSVATTRVWYDKDGNKNEDTQWHNCVFWGSLAERVAHYLNKGDGIGLDGELIYDNWEKDGVKRTTAKIRVRNFYFLPTRKEKPKQTEQPKREPEPIPEPNDDGLPF